MNNIVPESNTQPQVTQSTRPRGKNYRFAIASILTLLAIVNYLDRGNLSVAAPLIMKDLHLNPATMGVILSSFVWPYAIMNLPTGWAVDRFGTKLMMTVAVGLWSIVAILTGFMRTVGSFVTTRVLLGIFESPMFPAAIKASNEWFPKNEKGFAISTFIAGTQVGLALSPIVSTALMLAFGWPAMFVIIGAIGFVVIFGWIILYNAPEKVKWLSTEELEYIRSGQKEEATEKKNNAEKVTWGQWIKLFGHLPTWAMIIGGFSLQYLFWFYISWLPTFLEKTQHFSVAKTGIIASLPFIAGTLGVLIGGKISDKFIESGKSRLDGRRFTIALGAILTAIELIATAYSHSPVLTVTLLTLGMFTYSLSSAPYWALATEVVASTSYIASMGSIQNFGGFLGGALAPIVTGILVASSGGFYAALIVTAVLAIVSSIMYGLVLRKTIPV